MECEERVWYSWNEDGEAEGPVPKLSWSRRKQFVALVLVSAATPEIRSNSSLVPGSCADGPVRQMPFRIPPYLFFLKLDQQPPSQAEQSLCWMCWECSGTGCRQCPWWWLWRGGGSHSTFLRALPSCALSPCLLMRFSFTADWLYF